MRSGRLTSGSSFTDSRSDLQKGLVKLSKVPRSHRRAPIFSPAALLNPLATSLETGSLNSSLDPFPVPSSPPKETSQMSLQSQGLSLAPSQSPEPTRQQPHIETSLPLTNTQVTQTGSRCSKKIPTCNTSSILNPSLKSGNLKNNIERKSLPRSVLAS